MSQINPRRSLRLNAKCEKRSREATNVLCEDQIPDDESAYHHTKSFEKERNEDSDDVVIIDITLKDLKMKCKANRSRNLKYVASSVSSIGNDHIFLKPKEEEVDLDETLINLKSKASHKSSSGRKRRKCSHPSESFKKIVQSTLKSSTSCSSQLRTDTVSTGKELTAKYTSDANTEVVSQNRPLELIHEVKTEVVDDLFYDVQNTEVCAASSTEGYTDVLNVTGMTSDTTESIQNVGEGKSDNANSCCLINDQDVINHTGLTVCDSSCHSLPIIEQGIQVDRSVLAQRNTSEVATQMLENTIYVSHSSTADFIAKFKFSDNSSSELLEKDGGESKYGGSHCLKSEPLPYFPDEVSYILKEQDYSTSLPECRIDQVLESTIYVSHSSNVDFIAKFKISENSCGLLEKNGGESKYGGSYYWTRELLPCFPDEDSSMLKEHDNYTSLPENSNDQFGEVREESAQTIFPKIPNSTDPKTSSLEADISSACGPKENLTSPDKVTKQNSATNGESSAGMDDQETMSANCSNGSLASNNLSTPEEDCLDNLVPEAIAVDSSTKGYKVDRGDIVYQAEDSSSVGKYDVSPLLHSYPCSTTGCDSNSVDESLCINEVYSSTNEELVNGYRTQATVSEVDNNCSSVEELAVTLDCSHEASPPYQSGTNNLQIVEHSSCKATRQVLKPVPEEGCLDNLVPEAITKDPPTKGYKNNRDNIVYQAEESSSMGKYDVSPPLQSHTYSSTGYDIHGVDGNSSIDEVYSSTREEMVNGYSVQATFSEVDNDSSSVEERRLAFYHSREIPLPFQPGPNILQTVEDRSCKASGQLIPCLPEEEVQSAAKVTNYSDEPSNSIFEGESTEEQTRPDQHLKVQHPPKKLLSKRKDLSPNSKQMLLQALNDNDFFDHRESKGTTSSNPTFKRRKISMDGSPSVTKGILKSPVTKGILKSPVKFADTCSCTSNTLICTHAEKAITFSQRQMQDAENMMTKLLRELKSMKSIMENALSSDDCPLAQPKYTQEEMKTATQNVLVIEATTRKWLSMMSKDCNRFCKLMKSTDVKMDTSTSTRRKHGKKIIFADEAGGSLCRIKYFEEPRTEV